MKPSLLFHVCLQMCLIVLVGSKVATAQQPTLQITSPTNGAIVASGQNLSVNVTSPSGSTFSAVDVIGENPLGITNSVTALPAGLVLSIPSDVPSGQYVLTAEGTTISGQDANSASVTIDIERSDMPLSVSASLTAVVLPAIGNSTSVSILGSFADGAVVDVSGSSYLTYSSSNTAVATIDANGVVKALGYGNGLISAVYSNGSTEYQVSIPVMVHNSSTSAGSNFFLSVSPGLQEISAGSAANFTVSTTTYSGFTGTVTLSASALPAGATASFNPPTIIGAGSSNLSISTTKAIPPGNYLMTLTGTNGTISPTVQIEIILDPAKTPTLQSISVSPSNVSIMAGTAQFSATGTYSDGSSQPLTTVTWSSSATNIATISSSGLASPVAPGSSTISATVGSISGSTTLIVKIPGDVNGDGVVNCTDLEIVKASFGKSVGQSGYDPRADVNGDGVVNVYDLAYVSQHLPAGTTCP